MSSHEKVLSLHPFALCIWPSIQIMSYRTCCLYSITGCVLGIHVETNHPDSDETLVKSFNRELDLQSSERLPSENERPVREALTDLNKKKIPFVAAESGSIMIYTYCRTTDDIRTYVQMFRSRQLHVKITDIFQRLYKISRPHNLDTLQVKINIPEEYKRIVENCTGIYGKLTLSFCYRT